MNCLPSESIGGVGARCGGISLLAAALWNHMYS
jgi:hypothetical protein